MSEFGGARDGAGLAVDSYTPGVPTAAVRRRIGVGLIATILSVVPIGSFAVETAHAIVLPQLAIGDGAITEGTSTPRALSFSVTLDQPGSANVSAQYRIVARSATAGVDVDTARGATRTLLFRTGASGRTPVMKHVVVKILPDIIVEPDETFTVELANPTGATITRGTGLGTIRDDDPIASGFRAGVSDGSVVEGNSSRRAITFTVGLSERAPNTVSIDYTVTPMSASAGTDIVAPTTPRRLTFVKGANGLTPIAKMVTVAVASDTAEEGNETFAVVLSNPSVGVLLADTTGIGTIIDDEPVRRPLMGTAVRSATLAQEPAYASIAGSRFDILTPENEMKWDVIEPQQGVFNFAAADAIVNFAVNHGQTVHGHTLTWHQQNPAWLTGAGFTRPELINILTHHIATAVGRYRGAVTVWDVVNEAIGDDARVRPSIWTTGIGADAFDLAFFAARAADPNAKLYINDYNIEGPSQKSDALYSLVSGMVARGVPIDGVGFQTHRTLGSINVPGLRSQFDRYAALGIDVAITELDVRVPVPASAADLAAQAATYAVARDACIATPNCRSITTWGFTDKHSWIPYFFTGFGAALPWDANLQTKPAYDVIAPLLRN